MSRFKGKKNKLKINFLKKICIPTSERKAFTWETARKKVTKCENFDRQANRATHTHTHTLLTDEIGLQTSKKET